MRDHVSISAPWCWLPLVACLASISSCASLNENRCLRGDWQTLDNQSGRAGKPSNAMSTHLCERELNRSLNELEHEKTQLEHELVDRRNRRSYYDDDDDPGALDYEIEMLAESLSRNLNRRQQIKATLSQYNRTH